MTELVGWWPLNENSGNTARDLSGKGNHGTLNGGVTQGVTGKGGLTAYSFDGSNYVSTGLTPKTTESFSWSVWVRDKASSDPHVLSTNNGDGSKGGISIAYFGDKIRLEAGGGAGSNVTSTVSTSTNDGDWHHVLAGYDGSNAIIFIDGVKEVDESWSPQTSPVNLDIGRRASDSFYYSGNISDVRIYRRLLSNQEIQTLYDWGDGDYASPPNNRTDSSSAVSRWKFDGDLTDSWGSNDGTDNTSAGFTSEAIRGQAKEFDGDDDYVNIGDMGNLGSNSSQLTYSIWMSNEDTARRNLYGFNKDNSSTHNIQINSNTDNNNDPGNLRYIFKDSEGSALRANLSRTVPLNSGNFNHLVFTQDLSSNRLNFYFNSLRIPISYSHTQNPSAEDFPMDLYLGNQNYKGSANTPISGAIDEFRIYNRVLAPHEVFQLYQWGTRGRDMRKLTVNSR